jgi:hypothetical protein
MAAGFPRFFRFLRTARVTQRLARMNVLVADQLRFGGNVGAGEELQ